MSAPANSRSVERAIDAARRGWPVAVGGLSLLAVEATDPVSLAEALPDGATTLLISHQRAVTLKLTNQLGAATPGRPVLVHADRFSLEAATALVDPQLDLRHPLKGPFRTSGAEDDEAADAALTLARLAGLLPGWFVGAGPSEVTVTPAAVATYRSPGEVRIATRARLPIAGAPDARITAFRASGHAVEHVALSIGHGPSPPLVRLHSECLTGDALGSRKCDCGPQLHEAIARMIAEGHGHLLYLRQEGRGIGLLNKLRAYALQDQGFDTVDANTRLGFDVDERDYGVAAAMLRALGVGAVRLLTNNPDKVAQLAAHGVEVVERVRSASCPRRPRTRTIWRRNAIGRGTRCKGEKTRPFRRHPRARGDPAGQERERPKSRAWTGPAWIPAFAGMTFGEGERRSIDPTPTSAPLRRNSPPPPPPPTRATGRHGRPRSADPRRPRSPARRTPAPR